MRDEVLRPQDKKVLDYLKNNPWCHCWDDGLLSTFKNHYTGITNAAKVLSTLLGKLYKLGYLKRKRVMIPIEGGSLMGMRRRERPIYSYKVK